MVASYLHVDEIDAAIASLAVEYAAFATHFALPYRTIEGRTVAALRIEPNPSARATLLLTGGVHAREWVPPDALVYLCADILEAYRDGVGLSYGGASFTNEVIRRIVDAGLVIVPCVNPDGRLFSQTVYPMWRGNRRVTTMNGKPSFGVDLNRNFDFLWDFRRCFHPGTDPASDDAFNFRQTYHGASPASEPETRNIVWLYDKFPIQLLVDVHAAIPALLRSWGNDENQSAEPAMNFANPAFDGKRGILEDRIYREFIDGAEDLRTRKILIAASAAIKAVRNADYPQMAGSQLYPTSGAGDDYAFARAPTNGNRILAFTMECGAEFQPSFPEAEEVMQEVAAGLISICSSMLDETV